ncbi:hypothetical protein vBBaMIFTN4_49 [Bordetella phage vB_BaM-IFTN4]|nr:hypothetical protein vBBaMIFTN4_49 [Bordetella phage vB_BaM-IFTN4]
MVAPAPVQISETDCPFFALAAKSRALLCSLACGDDGCVPSARYGAPPMPELMLPIFPLIKSGFFLNRLSAATSLSEYAFANSEAVVSVRPIRSPSRLSLPEARLLASSSTSVLKTLYSSFESSYRCDFPAENSLTTFSCADAAMGDSTSVAPNNASPN